MSLPDHSGEPLGSDLHPGQGAEWLTLDAGQVHFNIPEGERAYLLSRSDGVLSTPPETSAFDVDPGQACSLDVEVNLAGGGRGLLYLIEYDHERRVATHKAKLVDGWNRLAWTAHSQARSRVVAIRLSGAGALFVDQVLLFRAAAENWRVGVGRLVREGRKLVFIAGCARSGTTLMLNMMRCFEGTFCDPTERPVSDFPVLRASEPVLVLKRTAETCGTLPSIPAAINLIYMVRHPFDVLTSRWGEQTGYYVTPSRWLAEYESYLDLVQQQEERPVAIVRYEDLVTSPDRVQQELAARLGLEIQTPFSEFHRIAGDRGRPRELLGRSLRYVRAPDTASLARWQRDEAARAHLESLSSELRGRIAGFLERFGYDRETLSAIG